MKMKGFWPLDDFPSSQSMKIDREESGEAPVFANGNRQQSFFFLFFPSNFCEIVAP